MKRIYIAGPLTGPPIEYLANCKRMEETAAVLINLGYAPFCPSLDRLIFLQVDDGRGITVEMIKAYSMTWMRQCEAVLLMPGWERSKGTLAEIEEAKRRKIPIYDTINDLQEGLPSWAAMN
jgi:nucleoside 2-deoxyribosyltransferase